jgi:DNA-binding transcriptional LysR family regulator
MELRQLRHFVAVADCGTYSAASEVLNLTQPALTRSVQTLEDQLQSALFTRQPRGVALTDAGVALLRHARLMLHQADAASQEVQSITGGTSGQLSIGLAPMFSTAVIDKVLIAMNEKFPDLRFKVTTALLGDLINDVADATLDVVLSNIPTGPMPSGVVSEVLFETRSSVLCSCEHPMAQKDEVTQNDLRAASWALVRQQQTIDVMGDLLYTNTPDQVYPTIETNSLALLRTLLLSGKFASVLPEHWLRDDLKTGGIVRLPVKGTPLVRPAGVIMREKPSREASVTLFLEQARLLASDWAKESDV